MSASASVVVPRRTAVADYLELTKPRITLTVLITTLDRGSSLIYTKPLYGGSQHLIHQIIEPLGFDVRAVPAGARKA